SAIVPHGAPVPGYAATPTPEPVVAALPAPVERAGRPARSARIPLAVATGAAATAAGAAYGGAWATRSRWADPDTPDASLASLEARTNTLSVLSAVGGVAALGLGAALVVSW
ncbi:MAG: hypothetical protein ABMB14_38980, partial [Myxococcota bacterium]